MLRSPVIPEGCQSNAHIFFLLLPSEEVRKHYESELKKRGVAAYTHYVALHSAPAGTHFALRTSHYLARPFCSCSGACATGQETDLFFVTALAYL